MFTDRRSWCRVVLRNSLGIPGKVNSKMLSRYCFPDTTSDGTEEAHADQNKNDLQKREHVMEKLLGVRNFTPRISRLSSLSRLVLLKMVFPVFCMSLVSFPANTTRPKHHFVLRRTQPRSNILSLSMECVLPFKMSVPSNLVKLLFGASQRISPSNFDRSLMSSCSSIVSVSVWRHLRFVSLWVEEESNREWG